MDEHREGTPLLYYNQSYRGIGGEVMCPRDEGRLLRQPLRAN